MVKIRHLNRKGDSLKTLTLEKAKTYLEQEIDNGNIVYDEDEQRIVEKATMGQIKAESNVAVFPAIQGG